MKNYIVRNCPALFTSKDKTFLYDCCNEPCKTTCKDITDCVLKRIVELCKDAQDECSCKIRNYVKCFQCTSGGRAALGKEILEMLEIEEVDE